MHASLDRFTASASDDSVGHQELRAITENDRALQGMGQVCRFSTNFNFSFEVLILKILLRSLKF